ncbi:hypothetical protein [Paenibacillus donghaensis]|uniref:Uncharacterized protein n=1 Tax=Paenibacillus donghaensis TaxID=414771 RepID=A0A2Z2KIK2_9BACL|nr:hypothetical protein [Paenibacillus donghaensis]ASA23955.1 hypothetical protein B9T62_26130 [Paenibacillus donghaensis]
MTALKLLTGLEYSRYGLSGHGRKQQWFRFILILCMVVIAASYLLSKNTAPRAPFISGSLLIWILSSNFSMLHMLREPYAGHKAWLLTFPHPRRLLVTAKALSMLRFSGNFALLILLAESAVYFVLVQSGYYAPLSTNEWLITMLAHAAFAICILPVSIVFGLASSLFKSSLPVLGVIPYLLLWLLPFMVLPFVNAPILGWYDYKYSSAPYVLFYTLAVLLFGWPAAWLLLKRIAGHGMTALERPRYARERRVQASGRITRAHKTSGHPSGFAALYQLDSSRLRQWGGLKSVQAAKVCIPLGLAVLFCWLSTSSTDPLPLIPMLFVVPTLGATMWMMMRSSFERKQLIWWLSFPQSRLRLLLSSIASVWVAASRVNVVLGLSALAGLLTGPLFSEKTHFPLAESLQWLLFSFLTYTLVLTLALGLLQISYYFMKSKVLALLMLPLYVLIPFQQAFVKNVILHEPLVSSVLPDYSRLGLVALIGLPVATLSVLVGAQYMYTQLAVNADNDAALRTDSL